MKSPTKIVALLIDGDNVPTRTEQIIHFCESIGVVSIKNAYGDWNQPPLSSHHRRLKYLSITCIQQDRIGKNATDKALKDSLEWMLDRNAADIYVIVSVDGHFATVCKQIRQKGAQSYVIAYSNCSQKLRAACDQFFDIQAIVGNQKKPSANLRRLPKTRKRQMSTPSKLMATS